MFRTFITCVARALRGALRKLGLVIDPHYVQPSMIGGVSIRWAGESLSALPCNLVTHQIHGQAISFVVDNMNDVIQREHFQGRFYETEELSIIAQELDGGVCVDVGANVGNHLIFFLKYLGVRAVVAFEPNPAALKLLTANIALNHLADRVDLHPVGLSDGEGLASVEIPTGNLGGAKLSVAADNGRIAIRSGDDLLVNYQVNFIKIDVEGMEMSVLAGLDRTIHRCRPKIFIEVDDTNSTTFLSWCEQRGYVVRARYRRYATNENYLVGPAEVYADVH